LQFLETAFRILQFVIWYSLYEHPLGQGIRTRE